MKGLPAELRAGPVGVLPSSTRRAKLRSPDHREPRSRPPDQGGT